MPLTTIESFSVSYLQVLDENGVLDRALEPELSDADLLRLHRFMEMARDSDQRMLKLQRQGRIGTFPLCTGQEAPSCGAALAMRESDWLVASYRERGARLMRGEPPTQDYLYYNGFEEGAAMAEPLSMRRTTPTQVILAAQTLHAVGIAYAMRLQGEKDTAVVTFLGDGATSQGDFHEALNFAAVWQVPVVFICQNNQWAISHPREKQTRSETIAQKAIAYGMPGLQLDGNDVLACYRATREALDRARSGGGPTLLEAVTYRLLMHTTADDPRKYRSEADEQAWWRKDPLVRFRKYLKEVKGLLTDADIERIQHEISEENKQHVQAFEARKDFKPDASFDFVFGTRHAVIEEQRALFLQDLARRAGAGEDGARTAAREEAAHG
ncbi:MAG: pyruvate dehydrogenase (acetyl-transferring) E1 component subunit alpha [Planctomycetes bacterium]|nr:pyruvate dehydrogenase (acetyl-transferring) E1 component subunit alpha [Planctomycetota bacterium]